MMCSWCDTSTPTMMMRDENGEGTCPISSKTNQDKVSA
jgi:hypothetical protein